MSDHPHCIACAQPIKPGDFVFNDVSGDLIHAACAGPARESFVRDLDTAEPLRKRDPKPKPWKWNPSMTNPPASKVTTDEAEERG